ncbi:MAG: transposase, partial [Fervidicoccus sp.]
WAISLNNEAMKMRAVNHKPVNHPMGALALQGG